MYVEGQEKEQQQQSLTDDTSQKQMCSVSALIAPAKRQRRSWRDSRSCLKRQQANSIASCRDVDLGVKECPLSNSDLDLDPCEHCHSTIPPLVLDVTAACLECGESRPCLSSESGEVSALTNFQLFPEARSGSSCADLSDDASSPSGRGSHHHHHHHHHHHNHHHHQHHQHHQYHPGRCLVKEEWVVDNGSTEGVQKCASAAIKKDLLVDLACAHSRGNVYNVTAMCQSCHTNRMLEVA
jgi:ABC-type nickel/cobalt efflux system permease component RcnA